MQVAAQGAVYDCLTEVAASGELRGELAESWESDRSGTRWRFQLRRDVAFHDGQPLTAADVVASLAIHGKGSLAAFVVGQIADLQAASAHVVDITLHAPNLDFPFLLAAPQLTIAPAGDFVVAIGTGLYRVEHFTPGRSALLARVQGHYKDGQAGWFDAVELTAHADVAALRAGQLDALGDVPERVATDLAADHRLDLAVTRGGQKMVVPLPPALAQDAALRGLAARAIDRTGLAGALGLVSGDHPLGPAQVPLPATLAYDPDAATFLARHGFDLSALPQQRFAGGLTEDWAFSAAAQAGAPLQGLGQDAQFNALLAALRAEGGSAARADMTAQLQALAETRGAALWPVALPSIDAHTRRLSHPDALGTLAPLDSARIAERWSFA
ncbi:peptide/nickel transport system substrate-binding protein [Ketogulonicigenium robustum]|uniref:Peptide/nickel transport system substrate-binding protein n=2 Tax=Ketogulonicigenium robustum TaxID=92947 RepID=A0A1W6P2B1_9RHOB|nr:peptide/nickel transport system substrate-binding protein [Ketogulonicigenium robustum]